ncbi:MAG: type II toxin-antitoxin system ParD family antitoxin [Bacteroidia bacterium]
MNVSLTDKQKKYIARQLEEGTYQNASELIREALRLHHILARMCQSKPIHIGQICPN